MSLGALSRAFAFEVAPRQNANFEGGEVGEQKDLDGSLQKTSDQAKLDKAALFNLRLAPDRSSIVRSSLQDLFSGDDSERDAASRTLASKLGSSMDNRSSPCLLMLSVHNAPDAVAVWVFPKESVIQRAGGIISIAEAFSLSSYLRKAALFTVLPNNPNSLISGHVVDKQSPGAGAMTAQFWTHRFLEAEPQITSIRGTTIVAQALRKANSALDSNRSEQQALHTAITQVRQRGAVQFSADDFMSKDLPSGSDREAVRAALDAEHMTNALFQIDVETFEKQIKFHALNLTNGVRVIIPFVDEFGDDVTIEGSRLTVSGTIESSTFRSTR